MQCQRTTKLSLLWQRTASNTASYLIISDETTKLSHWQLTVLHAAGAVPNRVGDEGHQRRERHGDLKPVSFAAGGGRQRMLGATQHVRHLQGKRMLTSCLDPSQIILSKTVLEHHI